MRALLLNRLHPLCAQKGLFIDTSHPELFDQYVPDEIEFDQVEGLLFEDDQLQTPVTHEFLLQDEGHLEATIEASTNVAPEPPLAMAHPVAPLRKLTGEDYFEIVTRWALNHAGWAITDENRAILNVLCDFHARLQELAAVVAGDKALGYDLTYLRALHSLWRGAELIFDPGRLQVDLDSIRKLRLGRHLPQHERRGELNEG